MNASLLSAVLRPVVPAAGGQPAPAGCDAAGARVVVVVVPLAAEAPACGWFESSWELQHGLAVSELPDSDAALAALWFPAWRGGAAAAAAAVRAAPGRRLQ